MGVGWSGRLGYSAAETVDVSVGKAINRRSEPDKMDHFRQKNSPDQNGPGPTFPWINRQPIAGAKDCQLEPFAADRSERRDGRQRRNERSTTGGFPCPLSRSPPAIPAMRGGRKISKGQLLIARAQLTADRCDQPPADDGLPPERVLPMSSARRASHPWSEPQ